MKDVKNKVAVVTGAASGIGFAMAKRFVEAGMRVVLSDVESSPLDAATATLRNTGGDVFGFRADVSKAYEIGALAKATLKHYGAVHVLCNNAGVVAGGNPTWNSTLDDWEWILGVNLMGVVHGVRTFLPIMIEQDDEAHIVNTASMAGLMMGDSLYGVTKAAVVSWSEGVYLQLVRRDLKPRVSVLCPGYVDTKIFYSARNRPAEFADTDNWLERPEWSEFSQRQFELLKNGLNPSVVADHILQAIHDERFYILTHPDWLKCAEQRMQRIIRGENPVAIPPPGWE